MSNLYFVDFFFNAGHIPTVHCVAWDMENGKGTDIMLPLTSVLFATEEVQVNNQTFHLKGEWKTACSFRLGLKAALEHYVILSKNPEHVSITRSLKRAMLAWEDAVYRDLKADDALSREEFRRQIDGLVGYAEKTKSI